ncbi:MAG: hypothetical protein KF787_00670 [Phycisphaeraceae bacterium]|nr:hypothetical protein [Phycisphaerae bacterium]MBX3391136.1 hypothetical protein [Phycisphaeraceae bacterium]HRJ50339.1 hypothetical protein [Phycisphaerales bacterium]
MVYGRRCIIESEDLRAEIDPEVGASLTDLSVRGPGGAWWPLLRRSSSALSGGEESSCYLLAPWSNRVRDGRFAFEGREVSLRKNWPDGTAIHGDVRDREWRILDRSPVSARLAFSSIEFEDINWPWAFRAQARYELATSGLESELVITNASDRPMPCGGGFHPFFNRILWDTADDPVVTAAVTGRYPCEGVMAVGPAAMDDFCRSLVGGSDVRAPLDDVFSCPSGRVGILWPASGVAVEFESSHELGHLVIYSAVGSGGTPRPHLCVEPVSMVNDGFNLASRGAVNDHGVRVLAPGGSLRLKWTMRILRSKGS